MYPDITGILNEKCRQYDTTTHNINEITRAVLGGALVVPAVLLTAHVITVAHNANGKYAMEVNFIRNIRNLSGKKQLQLLLSSVTF